MTTKSAEELHDDFLVRGGFANSSVWTFESFLVLLNPSIADVWRLLADAHEDYCLIESTATSTVAGTEQYALPEGFWRLRLLECSRSATGDAEQEYQRLRRVGLLQLNKLRQCSGEPKVYHLRGTSVVGGQAKVSTKPVIILGPNPSAARKLRFTYVAAPPILTATTDYFDGIAGYEDLVLEKCLYKAFKRMGKPLGECAQEIARLEEDLKRSAPNRDSYEPDTIAQHMAADGVYDCEEDY